MVCISVILEIQFCIPHMILCILKISYMFLALQKKFVHRLTLDNDVFLEFHLVFFFIKDWVTIRTLFKGPYHSGLYPLVPVTFGASKHAFITIKPCIFIHMASHPSSFVVHQVLRKHNISFTLEIHMYMTLVNSPRATSCHTLFPLVFPLFLWNKCSLMYGVPHLF
jgi:hypothetical protein